MRRDLLSTERIEETSVPSDEYEVSIPVDQQVVLQGTLSLPLNPNGVVLFAHGSGSSRHSPRNRYVALVLRNEGFGTLLTDLLSPEEEAAERWTRHLRFDINLLAQRLVAVTSWLRNDERTGGLAIGYFGASTGAAAALVAAAVSETPACAVVSRGGRPDLADEYLARVSSPTLLIVGADDVPVIEMNREAFQRIRCEKRLEIVPRATHLFEEPGTLEAVAHLASDWFADHCQSHDVATPKASGRWQS
jgi:putative phosphoribosyl transferase